MSIISVAMLNPDESQSQHNKPNQIQGQPQTQYRNPNEDDSTTESMWHQGAAASATAENRNSGSGTESSISQTPSQSVGGDNPKGWRDDLSNLLTPQTTTEQAQVRRRKRNREAARRSRQRQREREQKLVERQAELTERLKVLEQELVEWRAINSTNEEPSALIDPDSDSDDMANDINRIYTLTMRTLKIIGELQLQLDDITKDLYDMLN